MPDRVAFNHVGQCVTDLERSKRFYCELLGFTASARDPSARRALRAAAVAHPAARHDGVYLVRDGLVLELLHFAAEGQTQPYAPRSMNEPGLTHISLSVDDMDAVLARVPEFGGEVLPETNIGVGAFVRDPDGQLLELLPMAYRDSLGERPSRQ